MGQGPKSHYTCHDTCPSGKGLTQGKYEFVSDKTCDNGKSRINDG